MKKTVLKINLTANYRRITYTLTQSGNYQKDPYRIPFTKLPEILKVEVTQTITPISNGAETVIHGPKKAGKFTFYTGLRETTKINWLYGNDYDFRNGKKNLSLCLFHFWDNDRKLSVYYYTGWYHQDRKRLESIIPGLINNIQRDEDNK